jgi:hypothetical protein
MGQLEIPDGAIVYLDTAPIIYSIERRADYWQLLIPFWQKLQAGSITLISSELLILECLVMPLKIMTGFSLMLMSSFYPLA